MYDYDDMKCHANACVTPECYNRVSKLVASYLVVYQDRSISFSRDLHMPNTTLNWSFRL
jgi:hypothetical protein